MKLLAASLMLLACLQSEAQCTDVSLSCDKKQACAPSKVQFVLHKVPAGSVVYWDIGSGLIPGSDTFYHFFLASQFVQVKVQIKFPDNTICTKSFQDVCEIRKVPTPVFQVSRNILCDGPDSIRIISYTPNASQYNWVVDGTNYYNDKSEITHYFKTTGSKKISLYVIDNFGCRGVTEMDKVVQVYPDVKVEFQADNRQGCVPQKVQFQPFIQSSGEKITRYKWSFPKHILSEDLNENPLPRNYHQKGQYDVQLEVETDKGCIHTSNYVDYLKFGDSIKIDVKFTSKEVCVGEPLHVYTDNALPGVYQWLLPDADILDTSKSNQRKVSYGNSGYFDVGLKYNDNMCFSERFYSKAVYIKTVQADFSSNDYFHCALPHNVHYQNRSISSDSGSFTFIWKYYDKDTVLQRTSYRVNDSILIDKWGRYTVELIARHTNGCRDTLRKWGFMYLEPIRPTINAIPQVGCVGQEIKFLNGTPRSSYISPDTIYWKFYDKKGDIFKISREQNPSHSYSDTGFYGVTIHIGNKLGCQDSVQNLNFIEIVKPKLGYKISDSIICAGEIIQFEQNSSPSRAVFSNRWAISHVDSNLKYQTDTTWFLQDFKVPGNYDVFYQHNIYNGCRDSLTDKSRITVNGIGVQIEIDSLNGCVPMSVKAKAKTLFNIHKGNTSDTLQYKWSIIGSGTIVCSDWNSEEINLKIFSRGDYKLQLEVFNSVGCFFSTTSETITAGLQANFEFIDEKVCLGDDINALNKSVLNPTGYQWKLVSGSAESSTSKGFNCDLSNLPEGKFGLKLVANKFGRCSDSIVRNFEIIKVVASAIVSDSVLDCAPALGQFHSSSQNADTLIWSFGDGNELKTIDAQVANIYEKNSGWGKGFDIALTARSVEGCSDTTYYSSMVKVRGPVPNFTVDKTQGCDPLTVNFVNESVDAHYSFLNYNDGSLLDSTFMGSHQYKVTNYTGIQEFVPSIFTVDSIGCAAVYVLSDTIRVKSKPQSGFQLNQDIGCVPAQINYAGNGSGIETAEWLVNGKVVGTGMNGNYVADHKGEFEFSFITGNNFGCFDTTYKIFKAYQVPEISLPKISDPCLNQAFVIAPLVVSDTTVLPYQWMVQEDLDTKNYSGTPLNITFTKPGNKVIKLQVTNELGCMDSSSIYVQVFDPMNVDRPQIDVVSVLDNQTVEVKFDQINYPRFSGLNVYRGNESSPVFESSNPGAASFYDKIDVSQETAALCYSMTLTDVCGFQGEKGREHCQILLKADNQQLFKISLKWSEYKGWTDNYRYEIYKGRENEPVKKIATLPGYITEFLDSPLCNQTYQYFVQAVNENTGAISRSNSEIKTVRYTFNTEMTDVRNVSVNGNQIELTLRSSLNENFGSYRITKFTADNTLKKKTFTVQGHYFVDDEVEVDKHAYIYEVQEIDRCGYSSEKGRIGKTILLDGSYQNYQAALSWNTYQDWSTGVKSYQVQIRQPGEEFRDLAVLRAEDSFMLDKEIHPEIKGAYCYRIRAVSGDLQDTSYSNEICLFGASQVHIPNAFTPNGNDLNEVFKPSMLFVHTLSEVNFKDYDFRVYNRWGELMFLTHNMDEGWDGNYMGKPVQEGQYMYTVRAAGADNKTYKIGGSVTIIR